MPIQDSEPLFLFTQKFARGQLKIICAIKEHPKMAQSDIAALVGAGKITVQNAIVRFKEMGILIRHGSNKTSRWR